PAAPAATTAAATAPAGNGDKPKTAEAVPSNLITIKSPMIGTFYRRPSPDKPLFVEVGDEINPGKVVCIIEAMKLFNEIESEIKGKVVKILADDASPVEYDQPLFLVEPASLTAVKLRFGLFVPVGRWVLKPLRSIPQRIKIVYT
nr:acetyl-CoA carboxylase biotin carboxyl carrier protein [Flavihumibacter sp.]